MAKTKMDHVIELLERHVQSLGSEGGITATEPAAQTPTETITIPEGNVEGAVAPEVPTEPVAAPETGETKPAEPATEEIPSDDFDKQFAELEALINAKPEPEAAADVSVDEAKKPEPISDEDMKNYQKLYDSEVEKRIAAEGEARQAAAELTHRKSLFEKEGNKKYEIIDKQRELEAELRIAQAAAMPETLAPL